MHGRVVRNTEYVFVNATTIEPISQVTHVFNAGGLPQKDKDYVRSITGGEIATSYGYTAGLLTAKADLDGTSTTWAYDDWLRNITLTTAATSTDGNYPAKVQSFTYYSSGLKHTAQECSCSPATTTYVYDTAGRATKLQEPKPSTNGNTSGTLDTTYAYATPLKTTATQPNGATLITDLLLDGHVADEIGSGRVPVYYSYTLESGSTGNIVKTTKHDASGQAHGWIEETTGWLGRIVRQRVPRVGWTSGNVVVKKTFNYNAAGQLASYSTLDDSTQAALLPVHAYGYGELGLLTSEGEDVDGGGLGNVAASRDRITFYAYAYAKASTSWSFTKTAQVLATFNSTTPITLSTVQTRLTGFSNSGLPSGSVVIADATSTDASGRTTKVLDYVQTSARTRTRATTLAGASNQGLVLWQDGYLKSEESTTGAIRTYSYQDDGLLAGITDGANSATSSAENYLYYAGTKFRWKSSQSTDGASSVASTEYVYTWNTTATTSTVQAKFDGHSRYTESNALGLPVHVWGDGAQPAQIDYDTNGLGRRTKLTTWQTGTFSGTTWPAPSGGNATIWTLDNATGAITKKTYADLTHIDFTYNARGQVATRTWARTPLITTTYKYYGDAGVSGDATGELQKIDYSDGTPDVTFTYARFGGLATVADAAGTRTFAYRGDLKVDTETLGAFYGSKVLTSTYDPSYGRPTGWNFNGSAATATIGYDAVSSRPGTVAGALGSTTIGFSLAYDPDSRTDGVKTVTSTTSGTTFRRDTPLRAGYDVLASAKTTWNTSTTLGDFSAGYATTTARRSGQTTATSTYATQLGLGGAAATYGYDSVGRLNSSASTHTGSDVAWVYDLAGNRTSESDDTGFPSTSYAPNAADGYAAISGGRQEPGITYDADGNLKQDGTWTYSYDGENRLMQMTKSGQTLTFAYDYLGRRIRKTVTGTNASDTKFLWSGWNLAAEVSAANGFTVSRTFVWGPDFSNAQGQAGGAGSLLAQIGATTGVGYAITDTFGSAVGYFTGSGTTATLKLAVEYTAYGKGLAAYTASGATLFQYPIGYHGHYMDWETGLAYYGRRYYQPKHGRFINRDPIEEAGGNNLYAFVGNAPVNGWDVLGLEGGDDESPIVLPPYGTTVPREKDPFTTHLGPSSGYWLAYSLNDWGMRFVSTPSQVTHGSFTDPLAYLRRNAPNKKQLSKSDCDSLASKIGNNVATLNGIAQSQGENLNGGAVGGLRSMWDAVGYPAEMSGYAEGIYENGYRLAKTMLDASGNRAWRKSITGVYKSAAPAVNVVGNVLTAMDVIQLGVDINDRDGLMFISHSAEMGLGLMELTPGMNLVVMGSRYAIRDQLGKLQGDVDTMDATGAAAYNQETSRNVLVGTRNVNQWQKEWNDGGCARFNK